MNATHIHLILTHFPIIGSIIGMFILAYGLKSKNNAIIKIALSLFIAISILTIPTYFSGEEAEETVEHITGVSKSIIHDHEELAEKAVVLMGILGFASLFYFYNEKRKMVKSELLLKLIFAFSIITSILLSFVGNYGGQIRHSEIRKDAKIIKYQDDDDDD